MQTQWNWIQTNYTYDELNRLKTLWNYTYSYNTQWNITSNSIDTYWYDNQDRLSTINYDKLYNSTYKWDKINKINYDSMWNRTALENYRLKEKQTQVCTEETVVEEYKLPNWKTKTRERKVRNCTPEVTVVEKQLNTLDFTANELNQYTLLENKNKNGLKLKKVC